MIPKEILQKAIDKWGRDNQIDKIQEEAMELALALHQYKCPTKDKEEEIDKIYDELADMKIMVEYFDLLFDEEKINKVIEFKLNRLEKYLE